MTGHTTKGWPYALPTDALIDYPAASLELANLLQKTLSPVAALEATAAVGVTSQDSNAPQTIITAPAFTADGSTTYEVEIYSDQVAPGGGATMFLSLWEGSVCLLGIAGTYTAVAPCQIRRRFKPAAGSRTYAWRAWQSGTNGGIVYAGVGGAGTTHGPLGIRVTPVIP